MQGGYHPSYIVEAMHNAFEFGSTSAEKLPGTVKTSKQGPPAHTWQTALVYVYVKDTRNRST